MWLVKVERCGTLAMSSPAGRMRENGCEGVPLLQQFRRLVCKAESTEKAAEADRDRYLGSNMGKRGASRLGAAGSLQASASLTLPRLQAFLPRGFHDPPSTRPNWGSHGLLGPAGVAEPIWEAEIC